MADISGWVVLYGRIDDAPGIRFMRGCFAEDDKLSVPLFWHITERYEDPLTMIGHAYLTERQDGLYADCYLNNYPYTNEFKEHVRMIERPIGFLFHATRIRYARRRTRTIRTGHLCCLGFNFDTKHPILKSSKIEQINI